MKNGIKRKEFSIYKIKVRSYALFLRLVPGDKVWLEKGGPDLDYKSSFTGALVSHGKLYDVSNKSELCTPPWTVRQDLKLLPFATFKKI